MRKVYVLRMSWLQEDEEDQFRAFSSFEKAVEAMRETILDAYMTDSLPDGMEVLEPEEVARFIDDSLKLEIVWMEVE